MSQTPANHETDTISLTCMVRPIHTYRAPACIFTFVFQRALDDPALDRPVSGIFGEPLRRYLITCILSSEISKPS